MTSLIAGLNFPAWRLFGLSLRTFVDVYTGFDLVRFEETIGGTKNGESLRDKVCEQYGSKAVKLVTILIS